MADGSCRSRGGHRLRTGTGCRTLTPPTALPISAKQAAAHGLSSATHNPLKARPVAKPNYQFEKRQRELAKKRKKEEKAQRKTTPGGEPAPEPQPGDTPPVTDDKTP
jgi:hypothetical protein